TGLRMSKKLETIISCLDDIARKHDLSGLIVIALDTNEPELTEPSLSSFESFALTKIKELKMMSVKEMEECRCDDAQGRVLEHTTRLVQAFAQIRVIAAMLYDQTVRSMLNENAPKEFTDQFLGQMNSA